MSTTALRRIAAPLSILPILVAGSLLAIPAFAADETPSGDSTIAQAPASAVVSEHPGFHHGWQHGPMLTDDQLSKIADLREAARIKIAPQCSQLHHLKYELHKLMMAPTVDKAAALAIQSQINALKGELASARLATHIDIMSVLTPEQREGMRHKMLMHSAFGGGFHGGGECGGGACHGHGGPGGHGFKGHMGPGGHHGPMGMAAPENGPVVFMRAPGMEMQPPVALQVQPFGPVEAMGDDE